MWMGIAMGDETLCNEAWERMKDDNEVRAQQLMDVFITKPHDDDDEKVDDDDNSRKDRVIGEHRENIHLFAKYVHKLSQCDGAYDKTYVE